MPSTILLSQTIAWAQSFVDFESLTIGTGNEPAITNANTILQTILGPPFKWNWNRVVLSPITAVIGTQDYKVPATQFGFLEGASLTLGSNTFAIKEVKQELTVGVETGRPQSIAVQLDDNAGNITFRFLPVPDQTYTIVPYFQASPFIFTSGSLGASWSIPDKFSYIYNYGFLALTMAFADDARFPLFNQKFVAHLLGAQQGLSETEKTMFLDSWNLITRQEQLNTIKSQQGRQALGV